MCVCVCVCVCVCIGHFAVPVGFVSMLFVCVCMCLCGKIYIEHVFCTHEYFFYLCMYQGSMYI